MTFSASLVFSGTEINANWLQINRIIIIIIIIKRNENHSELRCYSDKLCSINYTADILKSLNLETK